VTIESGPAARELRERLADKNFLARVRNTAPAGVKVRTQPELDGILQETLRQHEPDSDIHVFGYGSLMWNPGVEHIASSRARIHGFHRCFCLRNLIGRGTPETPGLMLALDRGGSCNGVLLRIEARKVPDELALLWRREMSWGAYQARWVTACADSGPIRAVTFVVDRGHERYLKDLPLQEAARLIDTGTGLLGTCRSYFDATLQKLRELRIQDRNMEQLQALLSST
jgi:glutathione-specific gamma-glutamylcyclotransferase